MAHSFLVSPLDLERLTIAGNLKREEILAGLGLPTGFIRGASYGQATSAGHYAIPFNGLELAWNPRQLGWFALLYLVLYGAGRFGLELLRTDTTYRLLGLSRNGWISLALVIGGSLWLWLRERRKEREWSS